MTKKRALIVDDSKLARFVLKEMLQGYGIEADTKESAEEALGYLCTETPDVIFMDHTMPGMDGFKAVEAIKQDPKTTAIPIMMYTSKEGEVYVSQARALGAIGVLPKQLKPVELGQVLYQLKLISSAQMEMQSETLALSAKQPSSLRRAMYIEKPEAVAVTDEADEKSASVYDVDSAYSARQSINLENIVQNAEYSVEWSTLRPLVQELLDEQRKQIQEDISSSMVSVARQLAGETVDEDMPGEFERPYIQPLVSRKILIIVSIGIAALLGWSMYQYDMINKTLVQLQSRDFFESINTGEEGNENTQMLALAQPPGESGESFERRMASVLQTLQWALNRNDDIAFEDGVLGSKTLSLLTRLVQTLELAGFNGVIVLQVHTSEFCVTEDDGEWVLPSPGSSFDSCRRIQPQQIESLEFSNYLAELRERTNARINVRVEYKGNAEPVQIFPSAESVKTAGEWNNIAAKNKRIEIFLESDR